MIKSRNRMIYAICILITIALGLSSRYFSMVIPSWMNLYLGDVLWALMVFCIFGFLLNRKDTKYIAIRSLLFCFAIEISQLYQAEWINAIRHTTIGGLILGYGFLWRDLLSYSIGVIIGVLLEKQAL